MASLDNEFDPNGTQAAALSGAADSTLDWECHSSLAVDSIQRLVIVPSSGPRLTLIPGQELIIGRAKPSDHCLPGDCLMSRCHFSIVCETRLAMLKDMQSTNGTYLNGNRVRLASLSDRNLIVAGKSTFSVRLIRKR